jgi:hypothetical protein
MLQKLRLERLQPPVRLADISLGGIPKSHTGSSRGQIVCDEMERPNRRRKEERQSGFSDAAKESRDPILAFPARGAKTLRLRRLDTAISEVSRLGNSGALAKLEIGL